MGTNNSTLGDLASNKYLIQLASSEPITPNDPFWNQLLSSPFPIPQNSSEQHHLEESTASICKNFAINNCRTGNLCSLIRVFQIRAVELDTSAQCQDTILTSQTYNALFVIRNICKYFVENLTEEVVLDQFEAKPPDGTVGMSDGKMATISSLLDSIVRIIVEVPIVDVTYAVHLECINTILSLMSLQMFQMIPASESRLYRCVMQGPCSSRAVAVVQRLLQNYVEQLKCPAHLFGNHAQGGMLSAMASGLWTVVTLGMGSKKNPQTPDGSSDTTLANQSLLLLLVLINQYHSDDVLSNPYREAFFAACDKPGDNNASNALPADAAKVRVDFGELYKTVCHTLKEEPTMLQLYVLLHRVENAKAFILSRANIDQLVMPILKILYNAQEGSSHHMYMALIVILILSEDNWFSKAIHEMTLKNIVWFSERQIGEISLGGLTILILIRTIQYNMTRMRDQYLHTNCLAALANMSSQFTNLHPYVAQRLVSLFAMLVKKHSRAVSSIKDRAVGTNETARQSASESDSSEAETDQVQELAVLEEVMRMTLEILNSCLTHSMHHNPNLVYTMLYQRSIFMQFKTHPTFQDIIQNIELVITFFTSRLDQQGKTLSVSEVHSIIKQGAVQFRKDRLKKFPDLKFRYVEEEKPEEFFIPYVWSLVYHLSSLYFNPSRIQLFALQNSS